MDYVEGKRLRELGFKFQWMRSHSSVKKVHEQLASVYLQLRQLEFPAIGALGPAQGLHKPLNACDPDDIVVSGRPLTLDMALQESRGYSPGLVMKPDSTFHSTGAFTTALTELCKNRCRRSGAADSKQEEDHYQSYAVDTFHKFAVDELSRRSGPFVLIHGDLMLHDGNILFDENFNLVAVIDWEWSFVAPVQFLVPPLWLTGSGINFALTCTDMFGEDVRKFREHVEVLERKKSQHSLLTSWWPADTTPYGIFVIAALLYPQKISEVFYELLFWHIHRIEKSTTDNAGNFSKIYERVINFHHAS
jgi:hypothetical protein